MKKDILKFIEKLENMASNLDREKDYYELNVIHITLAYLYVVLDLVKPDQID